MNQIFSKKSQLCFVGIFELFLKNSASPVFDPEDPLTSGKIPEKSDELFLRKTVYWPTDILRYWPTVRGSFTVPFQLKGGV